VRDSKDTQMAPIPVVTGIANVTDVPAQVKYIIGEANKIGGSVISNFTSISIIECEAACEGMTSCLGFNWGPDHICEPLNSLRDVTVKIGYNIYVPDVNYTSKELDYGCDSCVPQSSPCGKNCQWDMTCEDGKGVLMGVATRTSWDDMDYMICTNPQDLAIDTSDGAAIADERICSNVINQRPFPITALWSNDRNFTDPDDFAYRCREIT
ncbi:unnamed protein product, partial [Meganyctiphanes norvegica]